MERTEVIKNYLDSILGDGILTDNDPDGIVRLSSKTMPYWYFSFGVQNNGSLTWFSIDTEMSQNILGMIGVPNYDMQMRMDNYNLIITAYVEQKWKKSQL